jgi:aminoglycoside phosphotransferase family enzyme/predicted kinase
VEWIQTHLSHVFLTGERVYKFRKAVDLGFVDFATRAARNRDCLAEVSLNRRLAPDVYLGVAALEARSGAPRIGSVREDLAEDASGHAHEHCVVMRRLRHDRDALSLLEAGTLSAHQLDRAATRVAAFHETHRLGVPAPFTETEWVLACTGPVDDNLRLLADGADDEMAALVVDAQAHADEFIARHRDRFEERRLRGAAVDAHGDLHLQHLFFEHDDADPIVIDCLEFSERLRHIDAASEVAFTAMDLGYRGEHALGERFLRSYARESGDFDLYRVVDYFIAYRAAVRAKVAAITGRDPAVPADQRRGARASALRHLRYAIDIGESRAPGALVVVTGTVGSGKSTAANALAEWLGCEGDVSPVVVASDRVRKRLAGLDPHDRSGADANLYTDTHTERTYDTVLGFAETIARSGRMAILDATFSERRHRDAVRDLATALGSTAWCVETRVPVKIALERLGVRSALGGDPSDAGPELHAQSVASYQTPDEWPEAQRQVIETHPDGWQSALEGIARKIVTSPR